MEGKPLGDGVLLSAGVGAVAGGVGGGLVYRQAAQAAAAREAALLADAAEAAASNGRPAGAAARIYGRNGKILFEEAVSSQRKTDAGPFGDIVRAHQGDPGNGIFAGGCAETCLARKIALAAERNPALRGRTIWMALFHKANADPCLTCADVLPALSRQTGSRVNLVTNAGRRFSYGASRWRWWR